VARNPFRAAADLSRGVQASSGGGTAYAGASQSRLTSDWVLASIQSADQDVKADYRTLKSRARELVRNNDTASRYVGLVDEQAIGPDGIRLQSQVKRPDGMLDLGINQRIEDAWLEWCEPENCTVDGKMGWGDVLQNWALVTPQDGEWLTRMLPFRGNRFGFALQLLDTDQLECDFNRAPDQGGNEIRMGVEIDAWGRPINYHVWDHHPTEWTTRGRELKSLPASQIVHYFRARRVGQTRGITWFAPSLLKLRHIGGYEEAEIIASRVAAAKGGFFEVAPEAVADPNAPNAAAQNQVTFEIEPGQFDRLPTGWTFKEWDPQHPTTAFKDFHKAMVRGVASGLGVSYVSLANDLEGVNFSSIRAGLLNERDAWRKLQKSLIRHFCVRVYREWLRWSITTGALVLPDRNRQRWEKHRWQPRGYPWVDPDKDINSRLRGVAAGVDSLTRIAAETGVDLEEVLIERAMETQLAKELGVKISLEPKKAGAPAEEEDDEEEDAQAALHPQVRQRLLESRALATLRPERLAELAAGNGNRRHQ
jgi:lambda family phage portal protein